MAGNKKMQAQKPSTDKPGAKFDFLAPAAAAGSYNQVSANTDGKKKK
jgi:hypothetical protein